MTLSATLREHIENTKVLELERKLLRARLLFTSAYAKNERIAVQVAEIRLANSVKEDGELSRRTVRARADLRSAQDALLNVEVEALDKFDSFVMKEQG